MPSTTVNTQARSDLLKTTSFNCKPLGKSEKTVIDLSKTAARIHPNPMKTLQPQYQWSYKSATKPSPDIASFGIASKINLSKPRKPALRESRRVSSARTRNPATTGFMSTCSLLDAEAVYKLSKE